MKFINISKIKFLLILFILYSCSNNNYNTNMVGRYESFVPKFTIDHYSIGDVLLLNIDSTYNYQTCGNLISGKWKLNKQKDSLLLFCFDFKYRNDSLNEARHPTCDSSLLWDKFKILRGDYLLNKVKADNNRIMLNIKLKKMKQVI